MEKLLKDYVDSMLKNESDEVKEAVIEISVILALAGYRFTPSTVRALELIHSYAEFLNGLQKK